MVQPNLLVLGSTTERRAEGSGRFGGPGRPTQTGPQPYNPAGETDVGES